METQVLENTNTSKYVYIFQQKAKKILLKVFVRENLKLSSSDQSDSK